MNKLAVAVLSILCLGSWTLSAQSQSDQARTKAKDTVDHVRQADPPQEKERQKDDTAERRAKEQNAKEAEHQKEVAKKYPATGKEPPPSGK